MTPFKKAQILVLVVGVGLGFSLSAYSQSVPHHKKTRKEATRQLIILCGKNSVTADTLRALIRLGADINAPYFEETYATLLDYAVDSCRVDLVKIALENGAKVNSTSLLSSAGITALHRAVRLYLYLKYKNYWHTKKLNPVSAHTDSTRKAIITMLLDNGADINAPAVYGTPFGFAVMYADTFSIKLFLARGASIDFIDKSGLRPIDYAQDSSMAKYLVSLGASPSRFSGESLNNRYYIQDENGFHRLDVKRIYRDMKKNNKK